MKIKSNLFHEYRHLKDINIPVNKKDVIERLQFQKGICRNLDSNSKVFGFDCRNDGTVLVGDYDSRYARTSPYTRSYAIHGKLEEHGKEAILKLYVYRTKGMVIALIISAIVVLICDIIIALACLYKGGFELRYLLLVLFVFLVDGLVWFREYKEMRSWGKDCEIFLSEIESRINGVIRWND